ncbi:acyl-CoA thioesterase [Desulfurivibrio sp. D14AmB]|uniref:acyl-CoA thioesterase n=1 Tax=Desulfurivibrio sp. D14AmB TaxID=3374370 RepID=UPI00376F027E
MGLLKKYFSTDPGAPPPLTAATTRRVRFEEVDMLRIVWHGRYPSYFEDGRIASGDRYGLSYRQFIEYGVLAPIVQMQIDYKAPLFFDEEITIAATLHWNDAVRLDYSYLISGADGRVAASGCTIQLLTDPQGGLMLTHPQWIAAFREKWRQGMLAP